MKTKDIKLMAVMAGSAAVVAGALATAVVQGEPSSDLAAGSDMQTGVTSTAQVAPSTLAVPMAVPSIKGPAPLPTEEQGLPG